MAEVVVGIARRACFVFARGKAVIVKVVADAFERRAIGAVLGIDEEAAVGAGDGGEHILTGRLTIPTITPHQRFLVFTVVPVNRYRRAVLTAPCPIVHTGEGTVWFVCGGWGWYFAQGGREGRLVGEQAQSQGQDDEQRGR